MNTINHVPDECSTVWQWLTRYRGVKSIRLYTFSGFTSSILYLLSCFTIAWQNMAFCTPRVCSCESWSREIVHTLGGIMAQGKASTHVICIPWASNRVECICCAHWCVSFTICIFKMTNGRETKQNLYCIPTRALQGSLRHESWRSIYAYVGPLDWTMDIVFILTRITITYSLRIRAIITEWIKIITLKKAVLRIGFQKLSFEWGRKRRRVDKPTKLFNSKVKSSCRLLLLYSYTSLTAWKWHPSLWYQ